MISPTRALPTYSILGETEEKRQQLISVFTDIVTEASYCLGKDEVRQVVWKVTRAPRGKRPNIDREQKLLAEYFAEAAKGWTVSFSKLPVRLHQSNPKQFGASAPAIEKHLHRLLRHRKPINDKSKKAARRWRDRLTMALNHQPTSILGSDT